MCDDLLGTWKLEEPDKENFSKYMEKCGVPFLTRTTAGALKPDVTISKDGDNWSIKTESTFKSTDLCFPLDKQFDETTADGRNVKTTVKCENGALVQRQEWDGKVSIITRQVKDGNMITTCSIDDVKCVRIYKRK
ncbi:fatty acid-binding protein, adipocyte-like [Pseudophryne corroboree]|uniref:fatty acid-binding protein, adipocyte-like n=1 Tax=Pseudophryne corroboree TaxID=495146 RepID=UPI003081AEAB